jgi:O-antigen/teichoic acid export membrane protein
MPSPWGLWLTLPIVLLTLWATIFWGVMQGQQNFFWLGWSMMTNGIGRFVIAAVSVIALQGSAAGIMIGVLFGVLAATALGAWHSRSLWLARPLPFDWRNLLAQVIPLALGFLGFQILFTADTVLVKSYFKKETVDFYVSAGTLSRALMWFVIPFAAVMFPRIVHSAVKDEKTDLMKWVLLGTGVLALLGAGGLAVVGPWVVRFVYQPEYVEVASSILPWYAAAMVPLAMSNVLLNSLFARPASKWAPALCIFGLAVGYLLALTRFHGSMVAVLQTMGLFNLALLACSAWFTWGVRSRGPAASTAGLSSGGA